MAPKATSAHSSSAPANHGGVRSSSLRPLTSPTASTAMAVAATMTPR